MGMFDYFRSSYDLGPDFTDVICQTKDIEPGYGGTMSLYWLDPSGYLYLVDYSHTQDLIEYQPTDPEYDPKRAWLNFRWVPNGKRGKIKLHPITNYITIRPEKNKSTCKLHFIHGRLANYEDITHDDPFLY